MYDKKSIELHKKYKGKLEIRSVIDIKDKEILSLLYTPGVGAVSREIHSHPETAYDYTIKGRTVAVVTDGSAVLGLGNIGPLAAMPVMEGKCALFKSFGNIDAVPICLNVHTPDEIINVIKAISPGFGGINLEDIKAPECFIIEKALQDIGIPVMHDDQHGTAIVTLAALINASKVIDKDIKDLKVIISGVGAAGVAIYRLLTNNRIGIQNIIMVDSKGILSKERTDIDGYKKEIALNTNPLNIKGSMKDALEGADVFIGVSAPNILTSDMINSMNEKKIVFAMANPDPEISLENAKKLGITVFATGRSDIPNQINNVLAFPGIFRGLLDNKINKITEDMKINASLKIADMIKTPGRENIIPSVFNKDVVKEVASAFSK